MVQSAFPLGMNIHCNALFEHIFELQKRIRPTPTYSSAPHLQYQPHCHRGDRQAVEAE